MVVYVSFLFHIYQPPGQVPSILKKISEESYKPLFNTLLDNDHSKAVVNINGILTEQLDDYGEQQVIDLIEELSKKKQIEFTGSAKYHAILPLIPEEERIRQIHLNFETNRKYFGNSYDPKGFFPPEMAVSPEILSSIKTTGHEWFIMSGIGNPEKKFPTQEFYFTNNDLIIVFRDDIISNEVSFDKLTGKQFVKRVQYLDTDKDYYVVIAQDGETYGHHVKHAFEKFLKPFLLEVKNSQEIEMVLISELLERFEKTKQIVPLSSSWSTSQQDLVNGIYFPLWYHPENKIHFLQHKLMTSVIELVRKAEKYKDTNDSTRKYWEVSRIMLDRGLHSCQQWWASKTPWYSPNMIINGLDQLRKSAINAYLTIKNSNLPLNEKERLELEMDEVLLTQSEIIHLL